MGEEYLLSATTPAKKIFANNFDYESITNSEEILLKTVRLISDYSYGSGSDAVSLKSGSTINCQDDLLAEKLLSSGIAEEPKPSGMLGKGESFYVTESLLIIAWSIFIIAALMGDDNTKESIITIIGNIITCIGGYWFGSRMPINSQKQ